MVWDCNVIMSQSKTKKGNTIKQSYDDVMRCSRAILLSKTGRTTQGHIIVCLHFLFFFNIYCINVERQLSETVMLFKIYLVFISLMLSVFLLIQFLL